MEIMDFDHTLVSYQVLIMISLTLIVHCCFNAVGPILTSSALNCAVEMKGLSRYVRKSKKFNKHLKTFEKPGIVSFYKMIETLASDNSFYHLVRATKSWLMLFVSILLVLL